MRAGPVSVPSPHIQMTQATFVVGALGVAWILYLAANNKLLTYWMLLTGNSATTAAQSAGAAASGALSAFSGTSQAPAGPGSGTPAPAGQAPFTGGLL